MGPLDWVRQIAKHEEMQNEEFDQAKHEVDESHAKLAALEARVQIAEYRLGVRRGSGSDSQPA